MTGSRVASVGAGAVIFATLVAGPAFAAEPRFRPPIDCRIGETCIVQNYVDRDPGPGRRDFACGPLSYDGHDGTDFRIPDLAAMQRGVAVLAAAPGTVRAVRDGVADVSIRSGGRETVAGRECGNGVVVDHADGWQTQYCHLRQGSVRVRPGERVDAGAALGLVGLSGMTEFPHVHFTVRRAGVAVDPFRPGPADETTCSRDLAGSLWAAEHVAALAYRDSFVLNAGFTSEPPTAETIESGRAAAAPPGPDAGQLILFARTVGARQGDRQRLVVTAPDGRVVVDHVTEPLARDQVQVMAFAGRRRPQGGWPTGTWRGRYTLERDGREVVAREVGLDLR